MPRISLQAPSTIVGRLAGWYSRRTYGAQLDPALAMAHNPRVLATNAVFELGVARWRTLDPRLRALAVMAAAHRIGCSWCTDFGYWIAVSEGVDEPDVREVPRWRESARFGDLDRAVLAYAETVSGEVGEVTDEQVAWLRARIGDAALVELTMMVAVENQRSRFNAALGLSSQGFADRCAVAAGS
jgi:alkylhydroperoxidase family enzyme